MPVAAELGVASVVEVLERVFGLAGSARGDEYDILCPVHTERRPSCAVNLTTGLWKCLACGSAGDLAKLGAVVLDLPRVSVEELLRPRTPEALQAAVQRKLASMVVRPCSPRRVELPPGYGSGPMDELVERGFRRDTLEEWGVQYCRSERLVGKKGTFTIRDCVAIPVRDEHGHLINWCYRRTGASPEWQPRYLYYTEGVSEAWFGADRVAPGEELLVVEGALDTIWCAQNGFNTWGMLGTNMGSRKLYQLTRFPAVTSVTDFDKSGALAVRRIGTAIGHLVPYYVGQYDRRLAGQGRKDPQDLDPVDLELAVARRISWTTFLARCQRTRERES